MDVLKNMFWIAENDLMMNGIMILHDAEKQSNAKNSSKKLKNM